MVLDKVGVCCRSDLTARVLSRVAGGNNSGVEVFAEVSTHDREGSAPAVSAYLLNTRHTLKDTMPVASMALRMSFDVYLTSKMPILPALAICPYRGKRLTYGRKFPLLMARVSRRSSTRRPCTVLCPYHYYYYDAARAEP